MDKLGDLQMTDLYVDSIGRVCWDRGKVQGKEHTLYDLAFPLSFMFLWPHRICWSFKFVLMTDSRKKMGCELRGEFLRGVG